MRVFSLAISAIMCSSSLAMADIKVMASIKPIHSLVASVMEGVGTPALIVDGNNSPHNFNLKPSDATALEQAQVIFWVGHELEAFLEKPLETLGDKATTVSLIDAKGIKTLRVREDANFEADVHEGEEHEHGDGIDAHVWLDPENAKVMLKTIAETLAKADPANAETYQTNAKETSGGLDLLSAELKAVVFPARTKSFIVFHDAYQYFETRFDIASAGSISVHPENPPGAKQITAIQKRIVTNNVQCVFSEPQFDSKLVSVILEGSTAKSAILDPVGATLEPGPALYTTLLRNLATNLAGCVTQPPG